MSSRSLRIATLPSYYYFHSPSVSDLHLSPQPTDPTFTINNRHLSLVALQPRYSLLLPPIRIYNSLSTILLSDDYSLFGSVFSISLLPGQFHATLATPLQPSSIYTSIIILSILRPLTIMSSFFYGGHQQQQQHHPHNVAASHSHHGRTRRAPRLSASQNPSRQYRARPMKDVNIEAPSVTAFRVRFEAGRSFDLDDDLEFCPNLLTDDERLSINSGSSDRSSLASGSPDASPIQHQIQPQQQVTPAISLSSTASSFVSPNLSSMNHQIKIHQPSAVRTRNAIPIVNPSTGMRVASPPSSISPGMMQQTTAARRW